MKQFDLFICMMLCSLFAFSQFETSKGKNKSEQEIEKQYENFKKTFDKELGDGDQDKNIDEQDTKFVLHLPPAELPAWMLSFDNLNITDPLFVFGISDPGLDTALAMEQARIRALGLLSLFSGANVQNITDVYSNEIGFDEIVGKFTSFSKVESTISYNLSHLKIYEQTFTEYGEAIVIAGIDNSGINTMDIKGQVMADYFLSEEGEFDDLFVYSTYNFELDLRDKHSSAFSCHNTRKSILISSTHNSVELDFDYGRFKYYFPQEITISDDELLNYSYTDLSDGLWNAYLSGILRQIEMVEKNTSEIKRMGDQYSGKFQNLSREISNIQLNFEQAAIFIKDNTLFVKLNVKRRAKP